MKCTPVSWATTNVMVITVLVNDIQDKNKIDKKPKPNRYIATA